ncbi:hypothetical protein U1Q18_044833 [Sarracenia purpurea var. burkii]
MLTEHCRLRTDCGSQTEPQQVEMALSLWRRSPSVYISAQIKPSKVADPAGRSTSVERPDGRRTFAFNRIRLGSPPT